MFSATYSEEIRELASRILRNPETIEVAPRNATADRVEQQVYRVPKDHKRHLLAHLINDGNWHQVLVFARTKHGANRLAQQLDAAGIRTAAIHGNKSQGARIRALADFKANKVTALVATEVAARGLDIKELPHVVNYELPNVPEDYVHRIGRTARAGRGQCGLAGLAGRGAVAEGYRAAAAQESAGGRVAGVRDRRLRAAAEGSAAVAPHAGQSPSGRAFVWSPLIRWRASPVVGPSISLFPLTRRGWRMLL